MKAIASTALAALLACVAATACSDAGDGDPDLCGEPEYGGKATDEAWRSVVDAYAHAVVGTADAPVLTSPTDGQVFAATGAVPTFTWTSSVAAVEPGGATLEHVRARVLVANRTLFQWGDAFWGGEARAHLPPITGAVFYLEIAVPGRECPVRVLTTDSTWTPDFMTWNAMKATTGAMTLTLTSAYLVENIVTEGPFRPAQATTFEVR